MQCFVDKKDDKDNDEDNDNDNDDDDNGYSNNFTWSNNNSNNNMIKPPQSTVISLSPRWSLSQLLCGSFQLRFVLQCSKFCILGAQFITPSIYYTLTVSVALIKQIICACNNTMRFIRFILVVDFKTLMFKSRLG